MNRNLIRLHARRRRAKQSGAVDSGLGTLHEEDGENNTGDGSKKNQVLCMLTRNSQSIQNMQVNRKPGDNAFDAFSILPISGQGHAESLMNHCAFFLVYASYPSVPPRASHRRSLFYLGYYSKAARIYILAWTESSFCYHSIVQVCAKYSSRGRRQSFPS